MYLARLGPVEEADLVKGADRRLLTDPTRLKLEVEPSRLRLELESDLPDLDRLEVDSDLVLENVPDRV